MWWIIRTATLVLLPATVFCLGTRNKINVTVGSRCPKPFQSYGVCRTSRDCPTMCCARINDAPTLGWSGKCCVPRLLTPIIRAKGWCVDKEDDWDKLMGSVPGGNLQPACPFPDDVVACGPLCTGDAQCQKGEACCTNVCGSRSCVRSLSGNDLFQ